MKLQRQPGVVRSETWTTLLEVEGATAYPWFNPVQGVVGFHWYQEPDLYGLLLTQLEAERLRDELTRLLQQLHTARVAAQAKRAVASEKPSE